MTSNSIWAQWMRRRYKKDGQFIMPIHSSHIWKAIYPHIGELVGMSRWIVGNGKDVSFWQDNWCGEILRGPLPIHASLTVSDAVADWDRFESLLSAHQKEMVIAVQINEEEKDKRVYTHSSTGGFSTAVHFKHINMNNPELPWAKKIWRKWLPMKISAFAWNVIRGAVPVDAAICNRNIAMVSKCLCCLHNHQVETLAHLLLNSDWAVRIWAYFARIFHMVQHFSSLSHLFDTWLNSSTTTQAGALKVAILLSGIWQIWKARCMAKYEGIRVDADQVIKCIVGDLNNCMFMYSPERAGSTLDNIALLTLEIPVKAINRRKGRWVKWSFQNHAEYQLNTEGSSRNGVATGGGVIRNRRGEVLGAFAKNYGYGSNMEAEVLALKDGLLLVQQLQLINVVIETDSMIAVEFLTGSKLIPWKCAYHLRYCKALVGNCTITHCFREGNQVADRLATFAHGIEGCQYFWTGKDLPSHARTALQRDQQGLYTFRK